jgi:hypothetical protein
MMAIALDPRSFRTIHEAVFGPIPGNVINRFRSARSSSGGSISRTALSDATR